MDKYEYYSFVKKKLEAFGLVVEAYNEIDYGLQFIVKHGSSKGLFRIYQNKKGTRHDLSQVMDKSLSDKIEIALSGETVPVQSATNQQSTNEHSLCHINLPQTFLLSKDEKAEVEKMLLNIGATIENASLAHIEAFYNISGLKFTFFSSGKMLIQGKTSALADTLYNNIIKISRVEHIREITDQIKIAEDAIDLTKYIEDVCTSEVIHSPGEDLLGTDLYNYLNVNDQIDLLDGLHLYSYTKERNISFKNYAVIVRNFAIVYEGFIIKVLIDCNIITEAEYAGDPHNTAIGTKLANNALEPFIKNSSHNKYILTELESVWQTHRNKMLHSDYLAHKIIPTFEEAELDIQRIKKVMREAFSLLNFDIIHTATVCDRPDSSSFCLYNVDIGQTLSRLVNDEGFEVTKQGKAKWVAHKGSIKIVNVLDEYLKVIGPSKEIEKYRGFFNIQGDSSDDPPIIIGTDESGKGDYFGPLVIAGVYITPTIAEKLISIGVQDSKKLSDTQISLLSQKIRTICPFYSVVPIGNEKYNELYGNIKNLNHLLGWGHARAIENILERVECNDALSDQFADASIIEKALMKHGKKITLRQRPKAEENIAVAAASILARNEFVQRLEQLGSRYGLRLPKGSSPQVLTVAKEIVHRHGKSELSKVAKVHFKTTEQV